MVSVVLILSACCLTPLCSGSSEERRLRAILLVDTLNFCFWPCSDWEYDRSAALSHVVLPLLSPSLPGLHLLFEMLLSTLTAQGVAPILWIPAGQFCVYEFSLPLVTPWTAGGPFWMRMSSRKFWVDNFPTCRSALVLCAKLV